GAAAFALSAPIQGPPGLGMAPATNPVAACEFMAAHGVSGRGLNYFPFGGYLLYRFWPERGRLPFVGIHPEDAPLEERSLYWAAFTDARAWHALEARFRFDYVLFNRQDWPLMDALDADSSWALVFVDDAASLYVRRD